MYDYWGALLLFLLAALMTAPGTIKRMRYLRGRILVRSNNPNFFPLITELQNDFS